MADAVAIPVQEGTVTTEVLRGWLKRAKRKYSNGVAVLKVTSQGKLVRRTVFIGGKEEYFEITSAKLFDMGYHMSDIEAVILGCDSPDFKTSLAAKSDRTFNPSKCCYVRVESRPISLVFKSEADCRDFVFLLRVEMRKAELKYSGSVIPVATT